MTRIFRWRAGGLAVLALIGAAPALAQRLERPNWRVGDTWTYRHHAMS